jgi:hypothetical protein
MQIPEMNEPTTFYLGQIHTAANGITTFALVQTVSAIFAFFSYQLIARYILHAEFWLIYPVIVGSILAYIGLVAVFLFLELAILKPYNSSTAARTSIGIGAGRAVLIVVVGGGLVLTTMAIRNPAAAGKETPAVALAPSGVK